MEIIGLFVHLETVAVTAVVFLFCSQVKLVFHIPQLRGANKSGHSGSPAASDRCTSLRGMGWQSGMRHAQPRQALGHGRLAPFSPPFVTPSSQARPGWMRCSDFCTAESSNPDPSCSPSMATSTHRFVSQHPRFSLSPAETLSKL